MGRSVAASKDTIPRELRGKVPSPMFTLAVQMRTFGVLFGLALAVFALYGPIVGHQDHNGIRYLFAPWLCPWVLFFYHRVFPYHPYRGSALFLGEMVDLDQRDPDAKRLDEVFHSAEAQRVLVRTSLKIAVVLFFLMVLITVAVHDSLNWSLSSAWQDPGLLVGAIGASIAVGIEYINWGLRTWAASYISDN